MSTLPLLLPLLQLAMLVAFAPLFSAICRKLEFRLIGASGPPLSEPWARLYKYLIAQPAGPTSRLRDTAVALGFGATVAATGLVPAATLVTPLGAAGGVVAFAGLLALGRAAHAAAALDSGDVGAARGAALSSFFSILSEPALIIALLALGLASGTGELGPMAALAAGSSRSPLSPARLLAGASLVLLALQASCAAAPSRAPGAEIQSPAVAMLQAGSGSRRALLELTACVRELALWMLFINLLLPFGLASDSEPAALAMGMLALALKLALAAAGVALARTGIARLRLASDAEIAAAAFALAALALVFAESGGAS